MKHDWFLKVRPITIDVNVVGILGDGGADPDGLVGGEGWGVERGVT